MPQTCFCNSLSLQNYDLIRLTPHSAYRDFVTSQKADFSKFLSNQETRSSIKTEGDDSALASDSNSN